ncbi:hypothetical protein KC19_1G014800 [Ceratodon purpureus]|uniref:Uncharacterized protein n=1 Tax=Ceratodon purpureus TaxID=3225 RepID=A0A8T0J2Q1_CERPU|nr:hypothetical protein KC19_1G014800 [Ceratodon purpureus]KAG0589346.1 hypothetical protein KC19_1G014800 [Ceratodon purpureus]
MLRIATELAVVASVQMLGEISDINTPYSRVLRTILQNLEQAIYSNYVTPHTEGTFDQVPYFELVDKLEAQNQKMLEEQQRWKVIVKEHKSAADGIQEHMEDLNDLLLKEKAKVAELQHDLLIAQKSLRKVTEKAKDLDHKVEQSRALVFDASNIKQKYEEMVEKHDNVQARYIELTKEVQRLQQNLAAARQEAADGVRKSKYNALHDELMNTQSLLQKAQKYERQAQTYTPRPNWPQIRGGPFIGFPTTQQAAEIVNENKELMERNLRLEAEAATLAVALAEAQQPKAPPEKKGKGKGGKGKGKKK